MCNCGDCRALQVYGGEGEGKREGERERGRRERVKGEGEERGRLTSYLFCFRYSWDILKRQYILSERFNRGESMSNLTTSTSI